MITYLTGSLFPGWYFQQRYENSKFSFKFLNNTDISWHECFSKPQSQTTDPFWLTIRCVLFLAVAFRFGL